MIFDIQDLIHNNLSYVIGGIVVFVLAVVYSTIQDWAKAKMTDIWNKFRRKRSSYEFGITDSTLSQNFGKTVQAELLKLRIHLDASRAYIVEMKNGLIYTSFEKNWRLFKNYESCDNNVSYSPFVGVPVTNVWSKVAPFFERDPKNFPAGVTECVSDIHSFCDINLCKLPRKVFLYDVSAMNYNVDGTKSMMENLGIAYAMLAPIIPHGTVDPIGYVGVDYTSKAAYRRAIKKKDFYSCRVCQLASSIVSTLDRQEQKKK